jgi:hypothetical protein
MSFKEIKPIKPVTLDVPKPELKPLDKTPLTRCELCLHYIRRIDNEHVFCMMYGETPHVSASEYCEKFTPMDKDPVLAYLYRNLLDYETDAEESVSKAVDTALDTVEEELKEASLCKEVDAQIDYCSDSTCRATVVCDGKEYKVELALSVKATISYAERGEHSK